MAVYQWKKYIQVGMEIEYRYDLINKKINKRDLKGHNHTEQIQRREHLICLICRTLHPSMSFMWKKRFFK